MIKLYIGDYMKDVEKTIINTDEKEMEKVNWTNAWSKKYPILANYQNKVDIKYYQKEIRNLLNSLKQKYSYNELDAMLVLKDILYHEWKDNK